MHTHGYQHMQQATSGSAPTCHLGRAPVAGPLDVTVKRGEEGAVHLLQAPPHSRCHRCRRAAAGCRLALAALLLPLCLGAGRGSVRVGTTHEDLTMACSSSIPSLMQANVCLLQSEQPAMLTHDVGHSGVQEEVPRHLLNHVIDQSCAGLHLLHHCWVFRMQKGRGFRQ